MQVDRAYPIKDEGPGTACCGAKFHVVDMPKGELGLKDMQFRTDGALVRLSWEQAISMETALHPKATLTLSALAEHAAKHSLQHNHAIDTGTVLLSGGETSRQNDNSIAITFKNVEGNPATLLRADAFQTVYASTQVNDLLEAALRKIYVPLRNFDSVLTTALLNSDADTMIKIRSSLLEMKSDIEAVCLGFETLIADDLSTVDHETDRTPLASAVSDQVT